MKLTSTSEFFSLEYNAVYSFESQPMLAFFLWLLFNPKVGGYIFLRNFGWISSVYSKIYPRRYNFS
jgi:hypothetical protein